MACFDGERCLGAVPDERFNRFAESIMSVGTTIAAAAISVAGMAAIVGWSLPERGFVVQRAAAAMPLPETGSPDTAGGRPTPGHMTDRKRNKWNCDECGVVESVRRIDTREETIGWCAAGNPAQSRFSDSLIDDRPRADPAPLADTLAEVIAGDRGPNNAEVTTRHRIVVRFRDGSRHTFDEKTPRTLRVGDRVKVIAGAGGANG
jgi:hypothetical protein